MSFSITFVRRAFVASSLLLLAACAPGGGGGTGGGGNGGGGPSAATFTVGGTVTGLDGTGLVLQDNSGDNLSVSAAGGNDVGFTFSASVNDGAGYAVTVLTQPGSPKQTCNVLRNGSGTVSGANVTNVVVDCRAPRYAYVANSNSADGAVGVSIYRVDVATGRLKNLGSVASGGYPSAVALDPSAKYAYVVSGESGNINPYTIGVNGLLAPMTPDTVWVGGSPESLTVHPSGQYLYVAGAGAGVVAQFTIGATGALTPMSPATTAAGVVPLTVTVDPSGRFAYVVNRGGGGNPGTVSQYTIGASGALTPMAIPTVDAGVMPRSVSIDPSGRFAYVTNRGDSTSPGTVSQYTIGTNGALTPMNPATVATGIVPQSVTVDPSGRYAYVANSTSNNVSQYRIDAQGALAPMNSATVAAGNAPQSVLVDPTGKYAYVASAGSGAVLQYTISADGSLAPNAPASAPAGPYPASIAMSSGTRPVVPVAAGVSGVYVANMNGGDIGGSGYSSTVSAFGVATNGELSPGNNVDAYAGVGGGVRTIATDPSGRYAYAATASFVSQYAIGANGTLTPMVAPYVTPATCYNCSAVVVHPSGNFAYVLDASYTPNTVPTITNNIYPFRIGADGSLTPLPAPSNSFAIPVGSPNSMAIDPSGQYAYVVHSMYDTTSGTALYGTISRYTIDISGALADVTPAGASRTGIDPMSIAVDPTGRFAYVANAGTNNVSAYAIDAATGALTAIDCGTGAGCNSNPATGAADFAAGNGPSGVAVDPSGKYVYVANYGDNTVSQFTIGANGALAPMAAASVAAGSHPRAITVDGSGQFVYVANYVDGTSTGTVSQFSIGADGSLTPMATATVDAQKGPVAITTSVGYQ